MTTAEKWTVIITALGVVATFSAVVVALWQTKIANRKRLKIEFSYINYLIGYSKEPYSAIEISNIGNRKVVISSCTVRITAEKRLAFLNSKSVIFIVNSTPKEAGLPTTLEPEDNLKVYIALAELYNAIVPFQKEYSNALTAEISDSTGKKHKCRCKFSLEAASNYLRSES